jgi:signal peptidase I
VRGLLRGVLWVCGIGGAIALLLYLFVFDTWTVPHAEDKLFETSVLPTLMLDDHLLIRRGSTPRYGELARCQHPTSSSRFVVGRVFGEGGDRVMIDDHGVTTNGKGISTAHGCGQMTVPHPVTENLVTMTCGEVELGAGSFKLLHAPADMSIGKHEATVEAGKLFIVSDNRSMHEDSRDFGQVDASTCEHIVFRLWGERYTDSSRRFTMIW